MRVVNVKFPNNVQTYSYYVPEGDEPKVGDIVLTSVSLPQSGLSRAVPLKYVIEEDERWLVAGETKTATVVEVLEDQHPGSTKATKIYLQLVSCDQLRARVAQNAAQVAEHKRRADAAKALDRLVERRSRVSLYEELAKTDPEARRLLDVFRGQETLAVAGDA